MVIRGISSVTIGKHEDKVRRCKDGEADRPLLSSSRLLYCQHIGIIQTDKSVIDVPRA